MKALALVFIASIALAFSTSCTSTHAENSYKLAQQGQTTVEYAFDASKDELHSAVLSALHARKWTVTDSGNPIKAFITHGQCPKLSITVYDGRISVDTKGSHIDGTPYVPINYLKHLNAQINKQLTLRNRQRGNTVNVIITDKRVETVQSDQK